VQCIHATLDISTIHAQVEKMHDEAVQLKVLQTALTLMQSTMLAQNEVCLSTCTTTPIMNEHVLELPSTHIHVAMQEGIAMVLGTCFRLLANSKNTDSVTNTAAATVRQVSKQSSWLFHHPEIGFNTMSYVTSRTLCYGQMLWATTAQLF